MTVKKEEKGVTLEEKVDAIIEVLRANGLSLPAPLHKADKK